MRWARDRAHGLVVARPLVFVLHEEGNRTAEGDAALGSGLDEHAILFVALGRQCGLPLASAAVTVEKSHYRARKDSAHLPEKDCERSGRRRVSCTWMSSSVSGILGGTPSTMHPTPAQWLSPNVCTRKYCPKELMNAGDGDTATAGWQTTRRAYSAWHPVPMDPKEFWTWPSSESGTCGGVTRVEPRCLLPFGPSRKMVPSSHRQVRTGTVCCRMESDALHSDETRSYAVSSWHKATPHHDMDALDAPVSRGVSPAPSDRSSARSTNRWWTESLQAAERSKQAMASTHDALSVALIQLQKLGSKVKNDISHTTQQAASEREELLEILLRLSREHREVQRRHRQEQELWERGIADNVRFHLRRVPRSDK